MEARPGHSREVTRPGNEICVDVRLRDVRDLEPFACRGNEVPIRVPERIDYQSYARFLASDQIAGLSETVVVEPFKQHLSFLLAAESAYDIECGGSHNYYKQGREDQQCKRYHHLGWRCGRSPLRRLTSLPSQRFGRDS